MTMLGITLSAEPFKLLPRLGIMAEGNVGFTYAIYLDWLGAMLMRVPAFVRHKNACVARWGFMHCDCGARELHDEVVAMQSRLS